MDFPSIVFLFTALLVRFAVAQESGWQLPGQVSATMCQWQNPRAAVVRDSLYIDGGYLWWTPGWDDGTFHPPTTDGNPLGLVYVLNFSTPFNTSQNISTVFSPPISKASNGGSANNIGPQYINGGMFANDYEWFIYGGLYQLTDEYSAPAASSVAAYEVYASGPPKQFQPGFILETLPSTVTRYITDGASASVPSENLGFYFSGLRSANFGEIYYLTTNESQNADVESATLMQLDMSVQQKEVWTNYTLPPWVTPRANAEIVWVPVSEKGILVAIGGVINPEFANTNQSVSAAAGAESQRISPTFMSTVSIYDIDAQTWYEQVTSGSGPSALTQGCTVLASADDGSSHNIYWYGGFDGLNATGSYSDDVWILSIPSFMWMKVYSGTASHGRAGHRCAKPYPDQMFVIGGYPSSPGQDLNCLEGFIQIFNLSSAVWLDEYNPDVWSNYSVPSKIYDMIGGSGTGGATQTAPTPTGFSNTSVAAIFATPYATSKITTWYPYSATETNTTTPRPTITVTHGGSGTPKYLAPLLGVVLGLFFITIVILTILLWRRRRLLRSRQGTSEAGTDSQNYRILNWVRGTGEKAPTVTTDETISSPYPTDDTSHPDVQEQNQLISEAGGSMVHEMMDTSKPAEMDTHPTGFVPFGPKTRQYPSNDPEKGSTSGLQNSPSAASNTSRSSRDSRPTISPVGPHSPGADPRADSPTTVGAARDRARVVSDISSVGDDNRGHLRGISETTVSTIGDGVYVTPLEQGSRMSANLGPRPEPAAYEEGGLSNEGTEGAISPLTPPEGVEEKSAKEGGDYVGQGRVEGERSETPTSAKFNKRSSFQERL